MQLFRSKTKVALLSLQTNCQRPYSLGKEKERILDKKIKSASLTFYESKMSHIGGLISSKYEWNKFIACKTNLVETSKWTCMLGKITC